MDANEATMGGTGTVTRKADGGIQAQEPVLRMTIQVTRAATGAVETYELIGTPIEEPNRD
jgi:hypothetical protein